ncbi:hypothetical protein Cgig2_005690 [Carnegiea gigantea]|uniref:glucan endo-1,3-beta-D-glucosidase n=1 Tax=Carnegiea gigantea TaxID=171969 RepID=A0A9Q1KHU6_9CARY|nr:hypothetical protein Cgig2_005690 [Carnegiea gigantea]
MLRHWMLDRFQQNRRCVADAIEHGLDGGIVTKQRSENSQANFGLGLDSDHHYHFSYFIDAISVLAKIAPEWGMKHRPHAYAMMLHSWAGGLIEFTDGRTQESASDRDLFAIIQAAQIWRHVKESEGTYEKDFSKNNKVVGVLWSNKRDSGLWFGPAPWRDCKLGTQVLPITLMTEVLFPDIQAAQIWRHVKESEGTYEKDFSKNNKVVGVLWSNKRDSGLWFGPAPWRDCKLGTQVLPITLMTEVLFPDVCLSNAL